MDSEAGDADSTDSSRIRSVAYDYLRREVVLREMCKVCEDENRR